MGGAGRRRFDRPRVFELLAPARDEHHLPTRLADALRGHRADARRGSRDQRDPVAHRVLKAVAQVLKEVQRVERTVSPCRRRSVEDL